MHNDTYLFKSEGDCEIVVNDGSPLSRELFAEVNVILSSYRKIEPHPSVLIYPLGYEEDAIQSQQRTDFNFGDWFLVAAEMSEDFEPRRALLMNKYRQEEGFVFDFILEKSIVHFFRYFSIQETLNSPILLQKDFLESINITIETKQETDYREFDDEEDGQNYFDTHPYPRKNFSPKKKSYIPNFGGSEFDEGFDIDEKDEEDEELEVFRIEVAKPRFTANAKGRPLDLNALDREEESKKHKARNKKAEEEEELEDFHIEVKKPAFSPVKKGKPVNLGVAKRNKEHEMRKKWSEDKKEAKEEKARVLKARQEFTPLSGEKPKNLDEVAQAEKDFDTPKPKAERLKPSFRPNYASEPSFNLRPDVHHHEISIINDPDNKYSFSLCALLYEKLKEIDYLRISARCLFVPDILPDDHKIFFLADYFKAEEWYLLAIIHDAEEKPLCALMASKKDENLAILISFRHRDPRITVISTKGISLNDPAYPFYSYRNLISIVKGNSPYKIGEN